MKDCPNCDVLWKGACTCSTAGHAAATMVWAPAPVLLPIRTQSPNGSHGHWRVLAKRRKFERAQARMLCPVVALPCVVKLTRLSAGKLDSDNLQSALKGVRDGCADALGVKDNDPGVVWEYAQEPIKRGGYGVIVEVRPA